ncbi:MAG: AAA family ATPase [Chloroflexi bacterium]|nr:AAA family ATPase [Chloroflexota bacterium]
MRIERVDLFNFRQYFGNQRLKFSRHDEQNVTIIHGVNGAGKTSLFLALNWCLYGEGVDNIGQIISKEAVSRAQRAEIVETKVDVTFHHGGKRYTASRKLVGQKQQNGKILEAKTTAEFVLMRTPPSGVMERVDNPIGTMNTILPANVRTYFFFDGEKIDNFARPEQAAEVEKAIYQVLDLETLTRAMRHLETAAQDLRGQLKQISTGELQKLVEEDELSRTRDTQLHERRDSLKREHSEIQRHLDEINKRLRDFESVQELQKLYDQYTQDIEFAQQGLEKTIRAIRDNVSTGYVRFASQSIDAALAILEEKRQRGEIPSNIREQFIQDLLARQICICGRPFIEHDDSFNHLMHLLETATPTSLEDDIMDTSGRLRGLLDTGNKQHAELNTRMAEQVDWQNRITSLTAQRDDVHRQMKGTNEDEIRGLTRQREEFADDLSANLVEQGRVEADLESLRTRIKELERQIEQAKKSDKRARLLSRKVELAQKAADKIDDVRGTFAIKKRMEIEQETRRIFHLLAWKGEHFQDVRLTDDYQLEVIDRYGLPARPELSAGERQVLSLSFITAMAMVAQREAPLIMDTPFGRLSSAHREAITFNLPILAPQLVLFVTDEELRDKALENLKPRIGTEYRLRFDAGTSCTTIEEMN